MRIIIGCIALLLSPVAYWLSGKGDELTSISISYWTDAGDIFVGALIAVGFFLSSYNGQGKEKDAEFYISRFACVFAIGIALFPTEGFSNRNIPPQWTTWFSDVFGLVPENIHFACAILLFGSLIALMWFFSIRALSKGKSERANYYRVIAIAMGLGILLMFAIGKLTGWATYLFWIEVYGLTLFGIGWLLAGMYKTE